MNEQWAEAIPPWGIKVTTITHKGNNEVPKKQLVPQVSDEILSSLQKDHFQTNDSPHSPRQLLLILNPWRHWIPPRILHIEEERMKLTSSTFNYAVGHKQRKENGNIPAAVFLFLFLLSEGTEPSWTSKSPLPMELRPSSTVSLSFFPC